MQVMLSGQGTGMQYRFVKVAAVDHQFASEGLHGPVLVLAVALGHHDHGPEAIARCSQGHTLAVVAAGRGNDTRTIRFPGLQVMHIDQAPAHLEGAGGIVILVLEPKLATTTPGQSGSRVFR